MDTFQFLVSVILILLKCEELTMQNVTFSNEKQSWKDAVNHCLVNGGVLESNITLLRKQDEFKNVIGNDQQMWIGKFKTLTNWTYIRGCYVINGKFQHFELELSKTVELQCQMLCNNYKFYSIKEADCYCIKNITSFVRSKNCNCVGCHKVWEHQLPNFGSADGMHKCIATTSCEFAKFKRSYKKCDGGDRYYVVCDIIVGISVSVTVLSLTIVVLLVFMFWRKYSTEQLSLRTVGSGDRNTNENEMDNYTATSDYEQIDNVDNINKGTKAKDQLHVTRIADTDPNTDQSNSTCSGNIIANMNQS